MYRSSLCRTATSPVFFSKAQKIKVFLKQPHSITPAGKQELLQAPLTLIQELLDTSKLLLEEHSDAGAHAAILADAVSQGVRARAREQIPLHTPDLHSRGNKTSSEGTPVHTWAHRALVIRDWAARGAGFEFVV